MRHVFPVQNIASGRLQQISFIEQPVNIVVFKFSMETLFNLFRLYVSQNKYVTVIVYKFLFQKF